MSNAFIKTVTSWFIKNSPAILTGTSVVIGTGTVVYSTWSGWKIRGVIEDEELDTKAKIKKIAVISVPIIIGTVAAGGCAIAAQKENSKRVASVAAGAAGAIALTNDEAKEKALELVNKDRKKESRKAQIIQDIPANSDPIEITDLVTGYKFKTTLSDFWATVNQFNQDLMGLIGVGETRSIADFYKLLLDEAYCDIPTHELITFGSTWNKDSTTNVILSVSMDSMLNADLKPIYTIDYDYIDCDR